MFKTHALAGVLREVEAKSFISDKARTVHVSRSFVDVVARSVKPAHEHLLDVSTRLYKKVCRSVGMLVINYMSVTEYVGDSACR